ncbi:unnamed protein product [Protopolystoma xenopodis]|uniref:DH domain-containing protein n=1 Tax=Protopolystoma xenopodis TaxID=117903 RepID=A0A448XJ68_9PLAT|nr:unnamed protein product [Protopolystoma xenopodis]
MDPSDTEQLIQRCIQLASDSSTPTSPSRQQNSGLVARLPYGHPLIIELKRNYTHLEAVLFAATATGSFHVGLIQALLARLLNFLPITPAPPPPPLQQLSQPSVISPSLPPLPPLQNNHSSLQPPQPPMRTTPGLASPKASLSGPLPLQPVSNTLSLGCTSALFSPSLPTSGATLPPFCTRQPQEISNRTSVSSASSADSSPLASCGGQAAGSIISSSSGASTATSNSTAAAAAVAATDAATANLTPEQWKLVKRRHMLLNELITTERVYIESLRQCMSTYRAGCIQPPRADMQIPSGIVGKEAIIFGNLPALLSFHESTFEPALAKYVSDTNTTKLSSLNPVTAVVGGLLLPEDVGHCFVTHSNSLANLYVEYCVNNVESTKLVIEEAQNYFHTLQLHYTLSEPLQSYLIKPVQRITKYQLLLRELRDCCETGCQAELTEGLEAMLAVPKRANDALHLSMLQVVLANY